LYSAAEAKPLTIWCLLVLALVAIVILIGVALFLSEGHGHLLKANRRAYAARAVSATAA
jgi:hypothetical protein